MSDTTHIQLAHGGGGQLTGELIEQVRKIDEDVIIIVASACSLSQMASSLSPPSIFLPLYQ